MRCGGCHPVLSMIVQFDTPPAERSCLRVGDLKIFFRLAPKNSCSISTKHDPKNTDEISRKWVKGLLKRFWMATWPTSNVKRSLIRHPPARRTRSTLQDNYKNCLHSIKMLLGRSTVGPLETYIWVLLTISQEYKRSRSSWTAFPTQTKIVQDEYPFSGSISSRKTPPRRKTKQHSFCQT